MNEVSGALYTNSTASGIIKTGVGKIYGVIVNSHTSGTLRLNDGLTTTTAGDKATATLTSNGTNVANGVTVTIGSTVYTFKTVLADAYDVLIGADAAASLDNLKSAINGTAGEGTTYGTGTVAHPTFEATTNSDTTQVIQALTVGSDQNSTAVAETSATLSWSTVAGGNEPAPIIVNTYTYPSGSQVITFPEPINFVNGLYYTEGGTADVTLIWN